MTNFRANGSGFLKLMTRVYVEFTESITPGSVIRFGQVSQSSTNNRSALPHLLVGATVVFEGDDESM